MDYADGNKNNFLIFHKITQLFNKKGGDLA